jgi:hypothetical protein
MSVKAILPGLLLLGIAISCSGCGGGGGSNSNPVISVALTPASAQAIDQGQTIQLTTAVTNDSSSAGVTWSMTGPGALSNQTTTSATYTVPAGTGKATVTATSKADSTKSASLSVTVSAPPSITTQSLPPATIGTSYNQALAATGGAGALTYSLASGSSLPAGLNLNTSSGAIAGTPTGTQASTVKFTAQVSDSSTVGPVSATQPLSVAVFLAPVFTTTSLPNATIGTPYNQTILVTGAAPFTFSITSGSLPTGLSLSGGTITGTPTGATGTTSFTVKVSDPNGASASQALSITVSASGSLAISTTSLLNPLVGEPYNQTLQYTAASATLPVTWSIVPGSGTLPAGLSLNAGTGAITGTPTAAGTSTFTMEIADSSAPTPATATQALTLDVTSTSVCGSGSESLLKGQYAISVTGFDASGPAVMLASFTADGTGKITAGTEDINSSGASGVQSNLPVTTATSSYNIGSDNKGCLTLTAGGVTRTFRFTVGNITGGVSKGGRIVEFNFPPLAAGTNTVGTISIQDPQSFSTASVTGSFNFAINSPLTAAAGGGNSVGVGVMNLNPTGPTLTGAVDLNTNGTVNSGNPLTSPITLTAGTYNIGANGRGSLSFGAGATTIHLTVYAINSAQLLMMSSDPQTATNPAYSGFAGIQAAGVAFAASSLTGTGVMFLSGQTAPGAGNSSRVVAGLFNSDGTSAFSFLGDRSSGGTIGTQSLNGGYTVATNGRVVISSTGSLTPSFIAYLVNQNEGLAISTDSYAMVGDVEPQTGAPFSNSSLSGTYAIATIDPVVPSSAFIEGVESYDGNGSVSVTFELNQQGYLSLGNAFTGQYTVSSNGRVVRTWNGNTQKVSYIISPTRTVNLSNSATDTSPTLFVSQQ